jgi:hypothetical protein
LAPLGEPDGGLRGAFLVALLVDPAVAIAAVEVVAGIAADVHAAARTPDPRRS